MTQNQKGPLLTFNNLPMKFEGDLTTAVDWNVPTRSFTENAKDDLDFWPNVIKSIWVLERLESSCCIKVSEWKCLIKFPLKSSLRNFYGRYGDLIKQYEVSLSQMLNGILWHDHIQWQLPTDQTLYRTRPSTDFWVVSIDHLRRVWHADRGRLLLRTPGPVPLGLAYVLLVDTNPFPNLSLYYRTMLFEYPSVLSRFCLGHTLKFCPKLALYLFKNMYLMESLTLSLKVILSTNLGGSKAKWISARRASFKWNAFDVVSMTQRSSRGL